MSIIVTTTGSYSPQDVPPDEAIELAIKDQIEAEVSVLVDGQVRSNIVGIFANQIGLEGSGLPYFVTHKIGALTKSITLPDLREAAKHAGGRPLKAHITGPTVIAENCWIMDGAPDIYKGTQGFEQLTLGIAEALAQEARLIAAEAQLLNIQYLQIDEPSLVFGAKLGIAARALQPITQAWKQAGGGLVILHVCGDYGDIFLDLLQMPVDILNLEAEHFQELPDEQIETLKRSGKHLAFGVIPVNSDQIPTPERIAREILYAEDRCGKGLIWGITPNCGMRLSHPEQARKRMKALLQAKAVLERRGASRQEVA